MPVENLDKVTLSGGIVNLTVGDSETPFDVHIELLCDCSSFFDRLFEDRFVNPPANEIRFPDDDPDAFADFICWAYCGSIRGELSGEPSRILHLFRVWTLAGKLNVPELQDLAMTLCKGGFESNISSGSLGTLVDCRAVNYAYLHTSAASALRQFVVDIWAERATKSEFLQYQRDLPRPFLEDLSLAWLDRKEETAGSDTISPPRIGTSKPWLPQQKGVVSDDISRSAPPSELANRKMKAIRSPRRTPEPSSPPSGPTISKISKSIRHKVRVRLPPTVPSPTANGISQ